jgi:molecular chaperone DnaK
MADILAKRALVIASSTYDDGFFNPLPAASADAQHLEEVLSNPHIGGFAVETLLDSNQRNVMRALESFFRRGQTDDLLLLHLSVHGWKDSWGQLHFVVRDTEKDSVGATAIPASFVNTCMLQSGCRRVVLMLDCCYSGAFSTAMWRRSSSPPHVDVSEPFSGTGRVVLTASTALQYAHEVQQDVCTSRLQSKPSVFTSAVVDGLRDGAADLDQDGLVSVNELYEYVSATIASRIPDQTPTLSIDSVQGTIYIARSPHAPEGDLLAELRSATSERDAWKRSGALHLVKRLLGSVVESTRDAARASLIMLLTDTDHEIATQALDIWHARGLGELPTSVGSRRKFRHPAGVLRNPVVGIDFGTTNSAIGVLEGGDVRLIPNTEGALVTPSVVAFGNDGRTLIGASAKRQAVTNPANTIRSVKLRLGTDWSIQRGETHYTAEDITTLLLTQLVYNAEQFLGSTIYGAVLTVPAYFDQVQRYSLKAAAEAAGINVLRIINEPTAASITYGLHRQKESTVLMFDLGGGTFDISLLEIAEGVCEVKATAGDNGLGGDDWDRALVDYLIEMVARTNGLDISTDPVAVERLREVSEAAKIDLSSSGVVDIRLPYLGMKDGSPIHLDTKLTRPQFERLTQQVLDRCEGPIRRVLKDASIKMHDVEHVILVGGATRMPAIEKLAIQITGKPPYRGLIPEGVVTGAALQAGILVGEVKDVLLLDVCPISLGIETKAAGSRG